MITKQNFRARLEGLGFTVSRCGACGIPKYNVWKTGTNDMGIEIRPGHTQYGTFVILKNKSAVQSGYLYDLDKSLEKYFSIKSV